jgi:hypothetical protein
MDILADTREYAVTVGEGMLFPSKVAKLSTFSAPMNDDNVTLYPMSATMAHTMASTTNKAVIFYDAETSLRNGQTTAFVVESDVNGLITKVTSRNVGLPSDEHLSAGVISSSLAVSNTSSEDNVAGSQTAAVLYSPPRFLGGLDSNGLSTYTINEAKNLKSGVESKRDGTFTQAVTHHYGSRMGFLRKKSVSSSVRSSDVFSGADTSNATQEVGSVGDGIDNGTYGSAYWWFDSGNSNAFTFATHSARISGSVGISATFPGAITGENILTNRLTFALLDEAGKTISTEVVSTRHTASNEAVETSTADFDIVFTNVSKPIKKVVALWSSVREDVNASSVATLGAGKLNINVETYEAVGDIPVRPIHVHIIEGLNASASIMMKATALLSSIPDSTNAKASRVMVHDKVVNSNQVEIYLKQLTRTLPRAMTVSDAEFLYSILRTWQTRVEVDEALIAMDLSFLSPLISQAGSVLQQGSRDVNKFLDTAIPIAREAARVADSLNKTGVLPSEVNIPIQAGVQGLVELTKAGRRTGLLIR